MAPKTAAKKVQKVELGEEMMAVLRETVRELIREMMRVSL